MRIFSDFICAQITMYHSHTVLLLFLSTIALQVNIMERGIQIKILISLPRYRERVARPVLRVCFNLKLTSRSNLLFLNKNQPALGTEFRSKNINMAPGGVSLGISH